MAYAAEIAINQCSEFLCDYNFSNYLIVDREAPPSRRLIIRWPGLGLSRIDVAQGRI